MAVYSQAEKEALSEVLEAIERRIPRLTNGSRVRREFLRSWRGISLALGRLEEGGEAEALWNANNENPEAPRQRKVKPLRKRKPGVKLQVIQGGA